jgi:Trypsin-like peptidase domain
MYKSLFAVAFALAIAGCSGAPTQSASTSTQDAPSYSNSIYPSLAFVRAVNSEGHVQQYGSGFCIGSDDRHSYILTDDHVIIHDPANLDSRPADKLQVILAGDTHAMSTDPTVIHLAHVVRKWSDPDLAILAVDVPNIPSVTIGPTDPDPGVQVAIAGYPYIDVTDWDAANPEASMHLGHVSAVKLGGGFIQYDGPTDNGNSGGPLFDPATGDVYGVVESVLEGDTEDGPPSVFSDVATPMLAVMPLLNVPPIRLTVDPKIITTSSLHAKSGCARDRKCAAQLRRFEAAYERWARAHGDLKSLALSASSPTTYRASFTGAIRRLLDAHSVAKHARGDLKKEAAAAAAMQTALRRMTGPRAAATVKAGQTFFTALVNVDAVDKRLAASLGSAAMLSASEKSEAPLREAAAGVNDAD